VPTSTSRSPELPGPLAPPKSWAGCARRERQQTLTRLTYLTQVSKEVRRYYKLVPATFFALVIQDWELSGYRLPAETQSHRLPPRDNARPSNVLRAADIRS
jgi:cytochrome P450